MARIILLILVFIAPPIFADGVGLNHVTTAEVSSESTAGLASCLHYKIIGRCFWLVCFGPFCKVESNNYVTHYLPDVVVSVYPYMHDNTWVDPAVKTLDATAYSAGSVTGLLMDGNVTGHGNGTASVRFKNVDVIGNPAASVISSNSSVFLHTQAAPYGPYYLSSADSWNWRNPKNDLAYDPLQKLPILNQIGIPGVYKYGMTFPRTGFTLNLNDAATAAVIAVRGTNIATSPDPWRIHVDLDANWCGSQVCVPPGITFDHNIKTLWQEISPIPKSVCTPTIAPTPKPIEPYENANQNYAWVAWRQYRGCLAHPGKFLFDVIWG